MKRIQILGAGCSKCKSLAQNAEQAAREMGIEYELVKVSDINEIVSFGVMKTPGLAINGTVRSAGRVVGTDEIKAFLAEQA
jgi:small redox-active disulfide protein 2